MRHQPLRRAAPAVLSRWPFGELLLNALLVAPISVAALRRGVFDSTSAYHLIVSVLVLTMLATAVARPRRLHVALLPLHMLAVVDLFLAIAFGARLTAGYALLGLGNHSDAIDFSNTFGGTAAICTTVYATFYLVGLGLCVERPRARRWSVASAGALFTLYGAMTMIGIMHRMPLREVANDLVSKEGSAPFGVVAQMGLAVQLHSQTKAVAATRDADQPVVAARATTPAIHVLVIGESSRPMNWQLFGYDRATTPRLVARRERHELVALPNVVAPAARTMWAVPALLNPSGALRWTDIAGHKSIVSVLAAAGFDTYWLSTQEADTFGGIITESVREAGHVHYLDRGRDEGLVPLLASALQHSPGRVFVVLHTKGSHFDYERRYPASFARFRHEAPTRREGLVDAYDNSIAYTDHVLDALIDVLERDGRPATLSYVSDHGENLLDDADTVLGHGVSTAFDLRSAAFVWTSRTYRMAHAEAVAWLLAHADAPIGAQAVAATLLQLADVVVAGADGSRSLADASFVPKPRFYFRDIDDVRAFDETNAPRLVAKPE